MYNFFMSISLNVQFFTSTLLKIKSFVIILYNFFKTKLTTTNLTISRDLYMKLTYSNFINFNLYKIYT